MIYAILYTPDDNILPRVIKGRWPNRAHANSTCSKINDLENTNAYSVVEVEE